MVAVDSHDAKTCVRFLKVLRAGVEVKGGPYRDPQSRQLRSLAAGLLGFWALVSPSSSGEGGLIAGAQWGGSIPTGRLQKFMEVMIYF